MHDVNPESRCGLHVRKMIVDKYHLGGVEIVLFEKKVEYSSVGLSHADSARDHETVKPIQKRKMIQSNIEGLSAPIGKRVDRNLSLTKFR